MTKKLKYIMDLEGCFVNSEIKKSCQVTDVCGLLIVNISHRGVQETVQMVKV